MQSFLEEDDTVAVLLGHKLTVKATGKRMRDEEIHLYEVGPDGKEKAFRHVLDTAKAIEPHSRPTEPDGLNEHLQGGLP